MNTNTSLQVIIPCWHLITVFLLCKIFHLNSAVRRIKNFYASCFSFCTYMQFNKKKVEIYPEDESNRLRRNFHSQLLVYTTLNAILKPTFWTTNRSYIVSLYSIGVCLAVITLQWSEEYSGSFMIYSYSCHRGIGALLLWSEVRCL
jgi:hypothetical protein